MLVSKFVEGAWVMILLVPLNSGLVHLVRCPLPTVGCEVATDVPLDVEHWCRRSSCCRSGAGARSPARHLRFALKISPEIYALHIAGDEQAMVALEDNWERLVRKPHERGPPARAKLIVLYSPYRRLYSPLDRNRLRSPREPTPIETSR